MDRIERIKKGRKKVNIWLNIGIVLIIIIVALVTYGIQNPDKIGTVNDVKGSYFVEIVEASREYKLIDGNYYLDVLSKDEIVVPVRTKSKETADKLIAIQPGETIRFIGEGVKIPSTTLANYKEAYPNIKISNIGLDETTLFEQYIPAGIGIVFIIILIVANYFSKKRGNTNIQFLLDNPVINDAEASLIVSDKVEIVRDYLFVVGGAGQLHYLRDYNDYSFIVNRHRGIVTGFTLALKNTDTKKAADVALPKLKEEQINILLNTLDNHYYPRYATPIQNGPEL